MQAQIGRNQGNGEASGRKERVREGSKSRRREEGRLAEGLQRIVEQGRHLTGSATLQRGRPQRNSFLACSTSFQNVSCDAYTDSKRLLSLFAHLKA
jgi:hypothetical protein